MFELQLLCLGVSSRICMVWLGLSGLGASGLIHLFVCLIRGTVLLGVSSFDLKFLLSFLFFSTEKEFTFRYGEMSMTA